MGALMTNLTQGDISQVIRLVQGVCDRWDDPAAWREHLLRGACQMLGGTTATMITKRDGPGQEETFGRLEVIAAVGLPEHLRDSVQRAVSEFNCRLYEDASINLVREVSELYGQIVCQQMMPQGWVTAERGQFTDDTAPNVGTPYNAFRKAINADDFVVSIRLVDVPRRAEAINVDRPQGAPHFGPREVALMTLLHDEIAPLIGMRLATERHLSRAGLSRRLRQSLSLLLQGRSEKEVARALRLHHRTVHQYVTTLYNHFCVSSRAELLAYFIRREPLCRPVPTSS